MVEATGMAHLREVGRVCDGANATGNGWKFGKGSDAVPRQSGLGVSAACDARRNTDGRGATDEGGLVCGDVSEMMRQPFASKTDS